MTDKKQKPDTADICARIMRRIDEGILLPGEKLPSERDLAQRTGASRRTIGNAYNRLQEEGYLIKRAGSGTFVCSMSHERIDLEMLTNSENSGITALLNTYNMSTHSKVLSRGVTTERFFTSKLGLQEGSRVFFLHRVRFGDGEPLMVEYTYFPAEGFEEAEKMDFSRISLYDYMDAKGRMPMHFNERFMVVDAPVHEAKLLHVSLKDPLYYLEFLCFDREKRIVEYTESYVRSDRFQLSFTNRA